MRLKIDILLIGHPFKNVYKLLKGFLNKHVTYTVM